MTAKASPQKVHLDQKQIYVPDKAKKRLRIGLFLLIMWTCAGFLVLAHKGLLQAGVAQIIHAKQIYISHMNF